MFSVWLVWRSGAGLAVWLWLCYRSAIPPCTWLPRRDVPSSLPPPSRSLNPSFQTVVNLNPSSFKISNRSQGLKLPNPSQARKPCRYQARQPQAINSPSSALALPRYKPQDASNTPLEEHRKEEDCICWNAAFPPAVNLTPHPAPIDDDVTGE
ncbi:hypothetical protein DFH08DRAFT_817877 [Mycena albidolilacea]|uniref:Uncharacterized protein n=1 Tax=Mycena albidolilacea TaxID=1033008 RepID=A0AAD6ZI17_9AGAR|nr:hypothetical protein DFH08DRAFT_817877 [Mycena albidolilacea]